MSCALNKKYIGVGLVLILLVTGLFIFRGNRDETIQNFVVYGFHVLYKDANELEKNSDLIIIGHTQKDFKEFPATINYNENGRYSDYYTVTDVKITKVIKGQYSKDMIPVIQAAALDKNKNILLISEDCSIMEKSMPYLLFLKRTDLEDVYSIMSVNQGKFNIDNTDIKEKEKEKGESGVQYRDLKEDVLKKYKEYL